MVASCGGMLRSSLSSKPPMVVFTLSLMAFALTTFSLSLYVSQNNSIPNPDVLSWNSLLTRISKLEFCLQPYTSLQPTNVSSHSPEVPSPSSMSISVPMSPKFAEQFRQNVNNASKDPVRVRGEIAISQLGRHLARYEGHSISISFEVPWPPGNSNNNNIDQVCLTIHGPREIIADMNGGEGPQNCSADTNQGDSAMTIRMKSHSQDEVVSPSWCDIEGRNETPMILEFIDQPQWVVFVTERDREMMQMHLLVTSVFISAILLTFLLAAFIRNTITACRNSTGGYSQTSLSDEAYFAQEPSSRTEVFVDQG